MTKSIKVRIKKMFKRVISKIRNQLIYCGFSSTIREVKYFPNSTSENSGKTLLIIGPGVMSIPSPAWGAVETIIHETILHFNANGLNVLLLNSSHRKDWSKSGKYQIDLILNHNDLLTKRVKNYWRETPLIAISHYGLAAFPEKWHRTYKSIIKKLDSADKVICLSGDIKKVFSQYISDEKLIVIPNGSDFTPARNAPKNLKLLYLGKVEKRKRQYVYAKIALAQGIKIEFIGPIVDQSILAEITAGNFTKSMFPGAMSRANLQERLGSYSALVLLSEGEADALVLYEAQLAGIPIVINANSLGSQMPQLPWVYVITDFDEILNLLPEIYSWQKKSEVISEFAALNFSWNQRIKPYLEAIQDCLNP